MSWIDTLRGPLFISWQMTRDCDLACLHCCTNSAPGKHLPDELSNAESIRFADEIIANDVPYVMLCGGEPLRVPHFLAIADRLGRAGVLLKIETNGQHFTPEIAQRLANLPIRSIQISLDGDTQEVYGQQRPGASLSKVHAACRAVRDAGMPLEITFAPTRLNIHEFEAVIARAEEFGAFRFNTGKLMRVGRAARLWNKIAPTTEAVEKFRELVDCASRNIDSQMQIFHAPFTLEEGLRQSVDSPPATMLVLPNGWVKVVAAVGYVCGDVRQTSLSQAWENYRAAWRNEVVIEAIDRAITDEVRHADANIWKTIPNGVMQACST